VLTLLLRSGRRHYHGPHANTEKNAKSASVVEGDDEKREKHSVGKDEGVAVSHEITS
jgi:hypothetical protein